MVRFIHDARAAPASSSSSGTRLRVIAAGLPRSATSSTQAALERLGYAPCLHMAEILPHPERTQLLLDIVSETADPARRRKLLARLVDGYAAVADLPVVFNTPDLMDMYPDVRVILNQRSSAAVWSKSAYESFGFFMSHTFGLVSLLVRPDRLWYRLNMVTVARARREYGAAGIFAPELHDRYYARVRAEAERRGVPVLDFRPEYGWAPLCAFLGVADPPPDAEFPRLNEAAIFRTVKYIVIARGLAAWALLAAAAWVVWRYGPLAWRLATGSAA